METPLDRVIQMREGARAELVAAMREREGFPVRERYATDDYQNFCFVGFAFETLRRKIPDVLFWVDEGDERNTLKSVRGPCPYIELPELPPHYHRSVTYASYLVRRWLGLKPGDLADMQYRNDHKYYTWEQLANELENKDTLAL